LLIHGLNNTRKIKANQGERYKTGIIPVCTGSQPLGVPVIENPNGSLKLTR